MDSVQLCLVVLFKKGIILFILLFTSCADQTEIPCPFGLPMKQLDEKCDFIQHGSTSKWILKGEKEYDK